jgi:glutamate N-acetyltransferase/amino-acid N-acetyltransferase
MDREAGVTAAGGFRAAGVAAGIKASGAIDLALLVNDGPRDTAAGVFTRNKVEAAPVLWTRQVLTHRRLRAIVLNSGGANACTGPLGFQDTHATAERVAKALDIGAIEVGVCSTGPIGERLPMPELLAGVDAAAASLRATPHAGLDAARAVMAVPRQVALRHLEGWTVGGFTKGTGPDGVLAVLTTDADIDESTLRAAAELTFDRLDVDGSGSMNDTVLLLASGAAGRTPASDQFQRAVTQVCMDLIEQSVNQGATGLTDPSQSHAGEALRAPGSRPTCRPQNSVDSS